MKRFVVILFCGLFLMHVKLLLATTYYIDWDNGDDSNSGLSKSTPWKRAPGMKGCWITDTNNNN